MKKSKIASLVLMSLVASNSFAQVLVNGHVDASYANYNINGITQEDKLKSENSYINFIAGEKLSGPISKIGVKLQKNFDLTNGSSNNEFNKSVIFLDTKYGQVWAGKENSPYLTLSKRYDLFSSNSVVSNNSIMGQNKYSLMQSNSEISNSIGYISPEVYYKTKIHVSHSTGDTDYNLENQSSLSAQYVNGPVTSLLSYNQQSFNDLMLNKEEGLKFGASYVLKDTSFGILAENLKSDTMAGKYERDAFSLIAAHNIGMHNLSVSYTEALDGKLSGVKVNDGANQLTFGYQYPLSKRTKIYGQASVLDNDVNANYTLNNETVKLNDSKHKVYTVGLSHKF